MATATAFSLDTDRRLVWDTEIPSKYFPRTSPVFYFQNCECFFQLSYSHECGAVYYYLNMLNCSRQKLSMPFTCTSYILHSGRPIFFLTKNVNDTSNAIRTFNERYTERGENISFKKEEKLRIVMIFHDEVGSTLCLKLRKEKELKNVAVGTNSLLTNAVSGAINAVPGAINSVWNARNAVLGVTNAVSGATNAVSGATNAVSGATNAVSGATNAVSGATNAVSGATNAVSGATNAVSGATNAVSGATSAVSGATNAVSGATNTSKQSLQDNESHTCEYIRLDILSQDISKLLEGDLYQDMVVTCEDQTFKAHRAVLCTRSEVFLAMLQSDMLEGQTARVEVKDMKSNICKELLHYMYSGKLRELNPENARGLYEAGDRYNVGGLMKPCAAFLSKNLTPDNVCEMLVLADSHSDENFKASAIEYILAKNIPRKKEMWQKFCSCHSLLATEVLNKFYQLHDNT